jgi:DNA-binding transcriptional LysR family regulator
MFCTIWKDRPMGSNPHKIDLNHLIDLDALLSEGSVSGAARRLHISAPAMSRRLSHLREALGDPLFVLAGRRMVPTDRALALRERVQMAVEDVRGILRPPEVDIARVQRTLTLRANDGFIGAWAARLVARAAAEAPGVRLRFMLRAEKGREALRSGEADLDLGVVGNPAPEIKSQLLFKASFVAVVRSGHPAGKDGRMDLDEFIHWPHVSASRRGHAHGPVDTALQALDRKRHVAVVVPGFQAALAMVKSSDLIATVPEPIVSWADDRDRLGVFPLPIATTPVNVAMSWHPRHDADPVHRWLRAQVRAITESAWR